MTRPEGLLPKTGLLPKVVTQSAPWKKYSLMARGFFYWDEGFGKYIAMFGAFCAALPIYWFPRRIEYRPGAPSQCYLTRVGKEEYDYPQDDLDRVGVCYYTDCYSASYQAKDLKRNYDLTEEEVLLRWANSVVKCWPMQIAQALINLKAGVYRPVMEKNWLFEPGDTYGFWTVEHRSQREIGLKWEIGTLEGRTWFGCQAKKNNRVKQHSLVGAERTSREEYLEPESSLTVMMGHSFFPFPTRLGVSDLHYLPYRYQFGYWSHVWWNRLVCSAAVSQHFFKHDRVLPIDLTKSEVNKRNLPQTDNGGVKYSDELQLSADEIRRKLYTQEPVEKDPRAASSVNVGYKY